MKIKSIPGLSAVALALALGGREAAADLVFQLEDVTFNGPGGTATGTFTTNDALNAVVTYDITTSSVPGFGLGGFGGFEYTPATAPVVANNLPGFLTLSDVSITHTLQFAFGGSGLTATGATLVLGLGPPIGSYEKNGADQLIRAVASGSVVSVPEPSSALTAGFAALAGLGVWARKRRARSVERP
jgi:hypothetical protein